MKKFIKTVTVVFITVVLLVPAVAVETLKDDAITISSPSAVLMEKTSGQIIYEKNPHERLAPASVTKIMTLLLIMEEIEAGRLSEDDKIVCSNYASSMGGSQIWLEEGEQMTTAELIKAVSVVSANDCSVALAEHISGSEESFVARMNKRAEDLGMIDTHFCDCTGLTNDDNHYTSAYDIAIMSRMLIRHDGIKKYTTIWMDNLRNGESELTNTNRLIKYYKGATGLKTGFTNKSMYCMSATAERNGTEYIAVVMHEATKNERLESAKTLLNYAFANYEVCSLRSPEAIPPIKVNLGVADSVQPIYCGEEGLLVEKAALGELRYVLELPESVEAPISKGDLVGEMVLYSGDEELARVNLAADNDVNRLTVFKLYGRMLQMLFGN